MRKQLILFGLVAATGCTKTGSETKDVAVPPAAGPAPQYVAVGDTTLRLVPPLVISADEVDQAVAAIGEALARASAA